jgi:hypothetical protein
MMDTTTEAERRLIALMDEISRLDGATPDTETYLRLVRLKSKALVLVDQIERQHDNRRKRRIEKIRNAEYAQRMSFTLRG